MAKERWFSGFEDGLCSDSSGICVADARWPARTGDFFAQQYGPQGLSTLGNRHILTITPDAPNNGDIVIARQQVAFRIRMAVTTSGRLCGFSRARLQQDGTAGGALFIDGTDFGTVTSNFIPTLGTWYVARVHLQYQRNNAGLDPFQTIVQIFDGASMDLEEPLLLATLTFAGAVGMATFTTTAAIDLGEPGGPRARIWDFDDWWISVADGADANLATNLDLAWPTGSRIQKVPITQQGPQAGWTGGFQLVQDVPNSAVAGNEQTSASAGLQTTFQHQTAAELGLVPVGQTDPTVPDSARPFTGLAVPEGLSSGASTYFTIPQDPAIPAPVVQSFTLTAGAGSFTNGVWMRAFTIEWRSQPGGTMVAAISSFTTPVFFSATAAPNFAALIQIAFNAATPEDRFLNPATPGTSAYRRYGLGVLITNGFNGRGLMNPATDTLNQPGTQTNTTELEAFGGPNAIDAGLWSPIVALFSTLTPNGTQPPYAATNPSVRPSSISFSLSSPVPSGTSGSSTATNLFGNVFQPPANAAVTPKPVAAAVKVYAAMKRTAGSGTDQILIDGIAHNISSNTLYGGPSADQFAIDWTERTAAEFDALVFGAQSGSASATQLGNCIGEVMTAGPCPVKTTGYGQYQQKVGIYVSNNGFQTIPVGFLDAAGAPVAPSAVFVKRIGTTATFGTAKAWWMGGTSSFPITGAAGLESIGIMSLTPTGFTVGPSNTANGVAATYAYVAIYDGHQDTVNDAYFVAGGYYRQGALDPDMTVEMPITNLFAASWVPDVVWVINSGTVVKTPEIVAPNSLNFATTGLIADGVTALGDKTFTTGANASVSGGPAQHAFFAMKFDAGGLLATVFQTGSFAGTGGVVVVPTNFSAGFLMLDHPAASYTGRFRSAAGNVGNNSVPWPGGAVTTTDITAIGLLDFTVGATASVVGQTSYWMAWKADGAIGNTGGSNLPPPGGGGGSGPPTDGGFCGGGGMHLPGGTVGENGCTAC